MTNAPTSAGQCACRSTGPTRPAAHPSWLVQSVTLFHLVRREKPPLINGCSINEACRNHLSVLQFIVQPISRNSETFAINKTRSFGKLPKATRRIFCNFTVLVYLEKKVKMLKCTYCLQQNRQDKPEPKAVSFCVPKQRLIVMLASKFVVTFFRNCHKHADQCT
jgi:hypothetical protein